MEQPIIAGVAHDLSDAKVTVQGVPDRPGMATGMAIMGFGGGALVGAPLIKLLLGWCARAPEYLGAEGTVADLTTSTAGVQFLEVAGQLKEVVVLTAGEAALRGGHPAAGLYLAGTGDSGVAGTFVILGIAYYVVMLLAALAGDQTAVVPLDVRT
mgnify:CR=1 FL=1